MWSGLPLEEALEAARATGITCLDLDATPSSTHFRPLDGPAAMAAVRPLLNEWQVTALTADHPDLPRAEEDGGEAAVEHIVAAMKRAKEVGAGVVSISLGSTEVDAWDAAWNRALSGLKHILHQTSRTGVRLGVILHRDDVFDSLRKVRRLLEAIPDPRLGLTLDTGLLHHLGIPLWEALEASGGRLHHVHLRDAIRRDPFRSIGRGEVSFPASFRALRKYGYTGALALDLRHTRERDGLTLAEALAESVPRLQEWLSAGE